MKTKLTMLSTALLMCACGGEKTFTVNGTAPEAEDGAQVVLLNSIDQTPIDTVEVQQGAFKFVIPATKEAEARIVILGQQNTQIMTDGVAATVNFAEGDVTATGTKLTDAWQQFIAANTKFNTEVRATMEAMYEQYKEDPAKHREEYTKYYEEVVQPTSDSLFRATVEANKLSPIGAMLFTSYIASDDQDDLEQIDAYLAEYPAANNYKDITRKRENLVNIAKTDVGMKFTDFTIKNIENTADVKLSDYVGKGKYVLVDFWASWCGPCKAEMPNLKTVQDKYGKDNFTVLGVNVWDKHDAAVKAVEEEGMTWPIIYDAGERESTATTLYGVSGIPTLILFAPDGTILNRTLRGEEMIRIVGETVTKK